MQREPLISLAYRQAQVILQTILLVLLVLYANALVAQIGGPTGSGQWSPIYNMSIAPVAMADLPVPVNTITVNAANTNQQIKGFGASDAWNTNFVGKYWDDQEKESIAELLFSQELDANTGDPLGIGLSMWRFNIGSGSAYQGDASDIVNEERRTEGFLSSLQNTYAFFDPASSNYLGALPSVLSTIASHSYFSTSNNDDLQNRRAQAASKAASRGLDVFQTEWCVLGHVPEDDSRWGIALHIGQVIYADMAIANASSWSFWTAMDRERYGHKNRFYLVHTTPSGGNYDSMENSGTHEASKSLWALGHYSRFIRPGYVRINLDN